ncbi:hypothetical protein RHMOL_Rhmol09G0103000 [Rhododendron molle]|uniref:Uncharacterized protein n=1 Tax=Rhododendron molle TaxID=49168 RepID=A0ACC0MDJ0_RHOML|nr:hypothetical protein RHMOL_Rhmol09G0103000 [Rhododendron molle]
MASSPPSPPSSNVPPSFITASRDVGKALPLEAAVLGGVSSTCVLRLCRRTPIVGGSSSQFNPPETKFEAPYDAGNEALPPFNADRYIPPVHIIGHGGSLRYRPPLSNVLPEVSHKKSEQHFCFTNVKVIFLLQMILLI